MAKLPAPATSGEMYMNAAVEELQRLNRNIEKLLDAMQPVEQGEEVELKEPEKKPTTRDAKQAADKATKKG